MGRVRVLLRLTAAVLLVAGCSLPGLSGTVRTGDRGGTGPVTLATGRDLTGYLRGRLAQWNRAHPAERATLVELPEAADDARAQMISSLQARSGRYDVLNLDVVWTPEFAAAGWITPLDPRLFPLDRFLGPVTATATFRGRLYAVPYVSNAGMLYYRKDVLDQEHLRPPRTWGELARLARTVAPRHGLEGYAGQFLPYEGLTVNYTEAVQSAGGQVLTRDGTRAAVGSPEARRALDFLVGGVREGWIPREALSFKEEESRKAFQDGRYLFLRSWPYVYDLAQAKGSRVAGRFGVVPLPGPDGPGAASLGGSDLAVSSYSRHQESARRLIAYLTGEENQRQVLLQGSLPPVWASLYDDPALVRRFPYLPVLKQSILSARPRPRSPEYDQVSLVVAAVVHDALTLRRSPQSTTERLSRELDAVLRRP
ncbi:ABC transporter substrate-binding protein [Streptacidiphilus sp. ASG 303]|uniref:ABC transporter substrate-binding protein n=1 Tax=Streptomycetaceae TaxID=2062 RepID=UPI001E4226B7|nr:ABC transporter substrate-binding protein [Streptacidiphilus sp. ASG 303]MCD0484797.1 ABC transporter substrate-binding protein [Streptacidiphilus sp. ASG 303]